METVLCSSSVDDSSTIAVSPEKLIRELWHNIIVSASEIIRDRGNSMDDTMDNATGDDATDKATVDVDEVLDKLLDHAIGAYGLSARDVYLAILAPAFAKNGITCALSGQNYDSLRETVLHLKGLEAGNTFSDTIFSIHTTEGVGNAHLRRTGFEVRFKSRWIRTMVLRHLQFLQYVETAVMVKEMRASRLTANFSGLLYEASAAKELAAGASSDLVLTKMKAEEGTTTFFVPNEGSPIVSPFNLRRERSYPSLSTGPLALKFNIPPGKNLSDYFWIPLALNNPLFDAFVIEFKDSPENINAVLWILQMTVSKSDGGSSDGYLIIRLIKKKVEEAMETMSRTGQRKGQKGEVIVKYVLVSPDAGRWTLPEKNRGSCKGDVYYQRVNHPDKIHVRT